MTEGWGRRFTVGVEEELQLVDPETGDLAQAVSLVLPERSERVKPELFESLLETTTPVCETAADAFEAVVAGRRTAARLAAGHGLVVAAAGSHPFARGADQRVVAEKRYERMAASLGAEGIAHQLVCGLHVHVGMPSREECLRALEGVLPWLPVLLSLSANSPYLEGEEAGARSGRAGRLAQLPRADAPPVFRSWDDWEAFTAGEDYTRMWWDARPHPRFGTLEVRMCDQPTELWRVEGLIALVQALAADASGRDGEPYPRDEYRVRRREAAVRQEPVDGLARLVEPVARRLGTWAPVRRVLAADGEADRQLEVGRAAGLRAVVDDVLARSAP